MMTPFWFLLPFPPHPLHIEERFDEVSLLTTTDFEMSGSWQLPNLLFLPAMRCNQSIDIDNPPTFVTDRRVDDYSRSI